MTDTYEIDYAINIAELWRVGKLIGGDEDAVRNALLDEVKRLRAVLALAAPAVPEPDAAYSYACSLAQAIFDSEYASDPDYASGKIKWSLCDSTAGVLTQIDNMVSGMKRVPAAQSAAPAVPEPRYCRCEHGDESDPEYCRNCGLYKAPAAQSAQDLIALAERRSSQGGEVVNEALHRMMPIFDKLIDGCVFTAEKAGQVAADMDTLRAAAKAEPAAQSAKE